MLLPLTMITSSPNLLKSTGSAEAASICRSWIHNSAAWAQVQAQFKNVGQLPAAAEAAVVVVVP